MFAVVFEVQPRPGQQDAYLGLAQMLRPELERVDGFVEVVRYRSLTRDGWMLSLSTWDDEKALVRWRTHARHHAVQERGRGEVFLDYRLRVGEVAADSTLPDGEVPRQQRLDETEAGPGTAVTLASARRAAASIAAASPRDVAAGLGLAPDAAGLVAWDVFDAVLTPGDVVLLATWRDGAAAERAAEARSPDAGVRVRRVRVVRDYGMFDRREAPQWFAEARR
jgi:heme-degrading monooxygenase HmoA